MKNNSVNERFEKQIRDVFEKLGIYMKVILLEGNLIYLDGLYYNISIFGISSLYIFYFDGTKTVFHKSPSDAFRNIHDELYKSETEVL